MSAVLGLMGKKKEDSKGVWHRVCLNTIVRKKVNLDSERLRILPMGSKVFVVEQQERRVRIEQPIAGWCSLRSSNGDTILTPLDDSDGQSNKNQTAPNAGEIRNAQSKAKTKQDDYQKKENELQKERAKLTEGAKDLQEITNEIDITRKKLLAAREERKNIENLKSKVDSKSSSLDLLKSQQGENNTTLDKLETELETLTKRLQEADSKVSDIDDQLAKANEARRKAAAEYERFSLLASAAEEETIQITKQMKDIFFETSNTSKSKLKNADVVMLKDGIGLVVVRWFGVIDDTEMVGVEFSDGIGNCDGEYNGKIYFTVKEKFGKFYPYEKVKKKILAEDLLKKLHNAVVLQTAEKNKVE